VLTAAERTCQMLCIRLAKLVTAAGCQSLLARAIHLAAADAPFLRDVRAGMVPGACLEGVQESTHAAMADGATADQTRAGLEAIITHLVNLLALFIGPDLTGRLVHDVWPDAPLGADHTDSTLQAASQAAPQESPS